MSNPKIDGVEILGVTVGNMKRADIEIQIYQLKIQ